MTKNNLKNIDIFHKSYLNSKKEIDFSDMISLSTKHIKKYGYKNKIKYIIIDEFQDTSKVRFNLIKEILTKTNANLLVVGDDFQSIYRFTGCDLKLFLDFNLIFKNSKILKIENTYRNSQELIDIAGSFIMKNNNQLQKDLKSNKHTKYPVQIIYYKHIIKTFINLINYIYKK
ncbi:MAG: UvrD-helicase domain-containing protein [Bacilli bacterium]|nr:UvrD-helicase domain-containing protein [Bacilli bacterium]